MDKQKQIEELAKVLCTNKRPLNCKDCVIRSMCTFKDWANELYNAGYRKIPENAVVLTREDFETEKQMANYWKERAKMWKQAAHDIRKETAKEIYYHIAKAYYDKQMLEIFRTYLKERFGVEVE